MNSITHFIGQSQGLMRADRQITRGINPDDDNRSILSIDSIDDDLIKMFL